MTMPQMNCGDCMCGSSCNCTPESKCSPKCTCAGVSNQNMNIQQLYPAYATTDPEKPITLLTDNKKAELIIAPQTTYLGPIDGFQNDNLLIISVQCQGTEQWVYHNMDGQDTHPLHFHLTSGFVDVNCPQNSPGLVSVDRDYSPYLYAKETFGIGPQQSIAFNLKFINYSSTQCAPQPNIKGLGYMYHCHFGVHETMVGMMNQFYVYEKRSDLFG